MDFLSQFTLFINYSAFIVVLWLGLYLVLHNPRYPIAWLTALTLWSLATTFLHYLLEPNYWPPGTFGLTSSSWFQGLAVAPALAFWHHATVLMRPKRLNAWRWTRILVAYGLAAAAIVLQATTRIWSLAPGGNALQIGTRQAGPLYPFFGAALLIFIAASIINLVRSARAMPATLLRQQLMVLAWATLFGGLTGPTLIIATLLQLPIPITVVSLLLAVTISLMGYGVARYSALMEGRTIHRDFFYNLAIVALVGVIYVPVCWALMRVYKAPPIVFIMIPALAVFTHSLINPAYRLVDRFLLQRETRRMRSDLQRLNRLAFETDTLEVNLEQALHSLCNSVNAVYGLVLTFEGDAVKLIANFQWTGDAIQLPQDTFKCDDVMQFTQGKLPKPFEEAALLVPLYLDNDQFGALLLGHPENGPRYAEEDVEHILDPAEMIGDAIHINMLRKELMNKVSQLAGTNLPGGINPLPVGLVENALRNLHDYAFLADSPLAELRLIQFSLPHEAVTHLDRGKAVHDVLLEAMNKLNPGTVIKRDPPSREWYPYLTLKEAYLDGVSNRDIMMHLYISEGTFNRTRRGAIRAVARTLEEMENNLR